ncbi:hypothetical protein HYDPIDRAFT_167326 [Hydnomerulius pinastri MD-312]|nr:hypothetical protein HYDPIDRAFT_167326 [Hydnomerulius pinastri MD-312]
MAPAKKHAKRVVVNPNDADDSFSTVSPSQSSQDGNCRHPSRNFTRGPRQVSSFWKVAFSGIGLPPCPEYISEPAYANLARVPACHSCFSFCDTILWELRLRCCTNCLALTTLNHYRSGRARKRIQWGKNLPYTNEQYEIYDDGYGVRLDCQRLYETCAVADVRKVEEACEQKASSSVACGESLVSQKALVAEIRNHSKLCRQLEYRALRERIRARDRLAEERLQDIVNRLNVLDWEEELTHAGTNIYSSLGSHKLVRKFEPVTRAHAYIERFRMLSKLAREPLERLANDPTLKVCPSEADIWMFPAVRKVLDIDHDTKVTAEEVSAALGPVLLDLMQEASVLLRGSKAQRRK